MQVVELQMCNDCDNCFARLLAFKWFIQLLHRRPPCSRVATIFSVLREFFLSRFQKYVWMQQNSMCCCVWLNLGTCCFVGKLIIT